MDSPRGLVGDGWLAGAMGCGRELHRRHPAAERIRAVHQRPGSRERARRHRSADRPAAGDGWKACTDTRCADVGCFFRPERPSHQLISLFAGIDRRGGWLARRRLLREGFVWEWGNPTQADAFRSAGRRPRESVSGDSRKGAFRVRGLQGHRARSAVGFHIPITSNHSSRSGGGPCLAGRFGNGRPGNHRRRLPG